MTEATRVDSTASPVEAPAFGPFFESTYPALCQALYLLTGDRFEAEDLAQEAMTRALERWDRVAKMDAPTGYVYRTAMNLDRKRIRRILVRARRSIPDEPTADHSVGVGDQQDVRRALATVPRGEREALVLVDWLELNAEEAGRVLKIAPGAVRVRLHRGRAKLRDELGGAP
jgi:RNA polymerase sigma-70 factor (ECF subfamily)